MLAEARKGLADGIDLVGHPSRQAFAETMDNEVNKPLNISHELWHSHFKFQLYSKVLRRFHGVLLELRYCRNQ